MVPSDCSSPAINPKRWTVPAKPLPKVERGILIDVAAFDWNCPQHITPRYTESEIAAAIAPLQARIGELEAQLGVSGLQPTAVRPALPRAIPTS